MPWRCPKKFPLSAGAVTVYLIHFTRPLGHARHYIGVTRDGRVEERLEEHRSGRGARICARAVAAGAELMLARIWEGVPRATERRFKNQGGAARRCPICRGWDR